MLADGLETTNTRNIEQERNISRGEVGHGIDAILAAVGFFGRKYPQEDAITGGIHGERNRRTLQGSPIEVGMIALEFGVHKAVGAFTGDGIVIIFLPDAIVGTGDTVLPDTVRTTPHPTHTGTLGFGI